MGKGNEIPSAIFKGSLENVGVLVTTENPLVTSVTAVPAIHTGFNLDGSRSEHELSGAFLPLGVGVGFDFDFHR
jgi:hypothetical protein